MDVTKFENSHPTLYKKLDERIITLSDTDELIRDPIDAREVFDLIRNISDPEHLLLTLEELNVVEEKLVEVNDHCNHVHVSFTPTIPHCSMAIIIGLCLKVKLMRSLPPKFKVNVEITPGAHVSESAINKQLADKERVMAALEKPSVLEKVNQCLTERKN